MTVKWQADMLRRMKGRQLEIPIPRQKEPDRNYHLGGRSFYFFDLDDNVVFLSTPLILFHKKSDQELPINSGEYARHHLEIGKSGPYKDFEVSWDDSSGTFRNFRDHSTEELKAFQKKRQIFIEDIAEALGRHDLQWKGPSWSCFYHATFNHRPVSVITARGHHPDTIKDGIELFVKDGFLPHTPNYLSIFPVNHRPTRTHLGDSEFKNSVSEMKQKAIRSSVEMAIETYGMSEHHRFGMSDDDPKNIELIIHEMNRLKQDFPAMGFFVIETQHGEFIKHEVTGHGTKDTVIEAKELQLALL